MEKIPVKKIKPNKANPRIIKDAAFEKLCNSLREFPEMAEVRPIIVNKEMVILGGNMRFKAMLALGYTEVPVRIVDWSDEKQAEFIIKDNVSGGEWDWDMLANEWDADSLERWGLDLPILMDAGDIVELEQITTTFNIQIKCDSPEQLEEMKFKLGITSNTIHATAITGLLA